MGIVIEIVSRSGYVQHCQVFDKDSISIGRAYTNDVVVSDEYVDATHAIISCLEQEGQFSCEDKSSVNGVLGPKGRKQAKHSQWRSGQVISLGKTLLRISSPLVPVPPATRLSVWEQVSDTLTQTKTVVLASVLCVLLALVDTYLSSFVMEDKSAEYATVLYLLLALSIYAGVLAFLGKAFRQDSRFWLYYTLVTGSMIVMMSYDLLSSLVFFNLNVHWSEGLDRIIYAVIIALLLNFSIRFASSVRPLTRLTIAGIIPCLVVINLVIQATKNNDFNPRPSYDVAAYSQTLHIGNDSTKADVLTQAQMLYQRSGDDVDTVSEL